MCMEIIVHYGDIQLIPLARNKAVSDGATSFYLDHHVHARVSKMTFGVSCLTEFNPDDPEHCRRQSKKLLLGHSGAHVIPGAFVIILPKASRTFPTTTFKDVRVDFDGYRIRKFSRRQNFDIAFSERWRISTSVTPSLPLSCATEGRTLPQSGRTKIEASG